VLGGAELAKTTLIVFYPLWPFMWFVYRWPDRSAMALRDWLREAGMLALRMLIGLYVLNLGYGFEGSFKPLKEYHFVSDLFTGNETKARGAETDNPTLSVSPPQGRPGASSRNRFAGTWLGDLVVPLPKQYVRGVDIQQRDFGAWVLAARLSVSFRRLFRDSAALSSCEKPNGRAATAIEPQPRRSFGDEFILLFPGFVIFVVVSSKYGFSEHMRYVLPAFPFAFIAISQAARSMRSPSEDTLPSLNGPTLAGHTQAPMGPGRKQSLWEQRMSTASSAIFAVLSCWVWASSIWVYPHSLAYFNESVGGPQNGPGHLLGSNIDWGQDLRYLMATKEARRRPDKESERWQLAYFGGFNPGAVGLAASGAVRMNSQLQSLVGQGDAARQSSDVNPASEFAAVSVNLVYGSEGPARDGTGSLYQLDDATCDALRRAVPVGRAGYSINLYSRH
jgi:hypothetical protein